MRLHVNCNDGDIQFSCEFAATGSIVCLVKYIVELHTVFVDCQRMCSSLNDKFHILCESNGQAGTQFMEKAKAAQNILSNGSVLNSQDVLRIHSELEEMLVTFNLEKLPACCMWVNPVCWWAGKALGEKRLCDYAGRNENTKLTLWLRKKEAGPPPRGVDGETHRQMLEFYHKRQQELARIEDPEDHEGDSYLNSAWSDPKELKRNLTTCGSSIAYKF